MKAIVYISPSMQPENKYAVGNTNEEAQCNRIAAALDAAMHRCGMESILPTNSANTMAGRVAESNEAGSALHMPIHTNAFNGEVAGLRIFVYKLGGEAEKIAKAIMAELAPITPGKSENISAYPQLYELNTPKAPAVYVEVDFHDNKEAAKWLTENPEAVGEALCKGICDHFKVAYVPAQAEKIYRVQVGAYTVKENAEAMVEFLKKVGVAGFLVEA